MSDFLCPCHVGCVCVCFVCLDYQNRSVSYTEWVLGLRMSVLREERRDMGQVKQKISWRLWRKGEQLIWIV